MVIPFLYYTESKWILIMKKPNLHKAISFTNTFYIFDCLDAELRKENVSRTKSSFLDINNGIKENKFSAKLYDKRSTFPLEAVSISFLNNNSPSTMFCSSTDSENLFSGRNNGDHCIFVTKFN